MRWTESDLATLKSKSRVIVHKSDVHANEPRSNTGTGPEKGVAHAVESYGQAVKAGVASDKTRSKKAQIALRGAKASALRSNAAQTLQRQCEAYGLPIAFLEWRFHETRKWRFDLAWTGRLIAVEIQGGIWTRGKHTRGNGYLNDMAKRNEANRMGWHVYEFTPNQVKTGVALEYLRKVLI